MKIIDMHCDTISCILDNRGSLYKNNLHIDIKRMKKYDGYVQFFAAYLAPEHIKNGRKRCFDIIDKFNEEMKYNDILFCTTSNNMEQALNNKKIAAFLSVEGADFIKSTEDVYELYDKGVRCMALTWNYSNALATGVLDKTPTYGLTQLGRSVIKAMNKCEMIVDVSHLSDRAFYDVANICEKPFIASHSNLRSVCNNPRNLTDEQFKIICEAEGGVGFNMYPPFVTENNIAKTADIAKHINKFLSLGGEDFIGLGCDFDGVDYLPYGIYSCEDLKGSLFENLKSYIDETVISKIFFTNFNRILHKNL